MALSKDFMANLTGNRTGGLTTGSSTTGLSLNALIQPVSSSVNTSVKPKTVQPKTLSFTENFKQNAKDVVSGSDDTYGGIIRNTILDIPQAIKDVVKKPKLLLEPAKLIAPGVFERVDAVKESIKQKSFEPLKKSFQEQLKESDIKGLVEITNGEFVRDGKGDIVINKEKADKIINQAIGFIGADLSDVSKQAAKNAAKNFLKQELERRMKYRASRTLEAPVSKAVVPVQPTIKPTGISLSTEQLTKPITQIAKTVQPGVVPTLKSYPYIEEATGQVKTELANVEAGYRTFREGATPQEDRVSIGVSSSFPDWLPDNGRSKKLIDQVLTMMDNGEIPKTSRLKSIYNSIQSAIDLETYKIILRKNPNLTDAEAEQIFQLEDTARQQELTPSQELTAEQEADVSKLQETTPDYATQLTKRNEQNLLQQARENLGIKPPVNPPTVRQLGLSPEPKPVVTTDEKLLKLRLSSEVRGSKEGFRAGVTQTREKLLTQFREKNIEVAEAKKTLVDYIKESLPPANRGMFLSAIKNVGTKAELVKYIDKVDNASNRIELSTAINELKSSIDKILSSPSIDIGYKEELTNFMKDFDLTKMTSKTRERLEQLMKVQESGIKLPVGLQEKMERLSKKSLADMTVDEVRNIADYVAAIQKMGQTKFRTYRNLEEALKETWMEDIKSDAIKTDYVELEQAKIGEPLKIPEKFKNSFRTAANEALALDKALLPMDIVFEMMGPSTKRIVKGTIDSDYQSYLTNFHKDSENIVNKVQELKLDEGNLERIGAYAASQQSGGIDKLLSMGYSQKELDSLVLNDNEQKFYEFTRNFYDEKYPAIANVMREVYNQPVKKVDNYFSYFTDFTKAPQLEVVDMLNSAPQYEVLKKNVEQGITKRRVGGQQAIKLNALDVLLKYADTSDYLVALSKNTKLLSEMAKQQEFANAVGDLNQIITVDYLDTIARRGGRGGQEAIIILDFIRRNTGVAQLGLKLTSTLRQPMALLDGAAIIGNDAFAGAYEVATNDGIRIYIKENFPELKDRIGDDPAFKELSKNKTFKKIQEIGMKPLTGLDSVTASSVTWGAYMKKMRELGLEIDLTQPANKEAVAYAQEVLRNTQSTSSFKDVPQIISRGKFGTHNMPMSLSKSLLQFQSFPLIAKWARWRYTLPKAIREQRYADAARILQYLIISLLAETGVGYAYQKIRDEMTGKDSGRSYTKDLAMNALSTVPFSSFIISPMIYDTSPIPSLEFSGLSGIPKAFTATNPETRARGVVDALATIGKVVGIPGTSQIQQTIKDIIPQVQNESKTIKIPKPKSSGLSGGFGTGGFGGGFGTGGFK